MNAKDFLRLGVPLGEPTRRATDFISKFILGGGDKLRLQEEVESIVRNPSAFVNDPLRGEFARALLKAPPPPRTEPIKYRQWGEGLEHEAIMQMEKACLLPVAVAGALMPDAHVGYGLPIGGVLATENAVIPYAVGVDIACRMKMTVLDIPVRDLEHKLDRLTRAIEVETRFGVGAVFKERRDHEVLDADWSASPITRKNKDRAWSQLGTSGSGNHFVEFGLFTAHGPIQGLEPGNLRGVAIPQRQSRHGCGGVRSLFKAGLRPVQGSARRTETAGLAIAGFAGGPGILGGDGIDGPVRGGQPRSHPPAHRGQPRRAGFIGLGKPPQFRVEGTACDWRRGTGRSLCIAKARRRRAKACWASSPVRWRRRDLSSAARANLNASSSLYWLGETMRKTLRKSSRTYEKRGTILSRKMMCQLPFDHEHQKEN